MKAVLMAIHRKWCEKIFRGEKTIEVRNIKPKDGYPVKVYVYESIGRGEGAGAVVGEFECDGLYDIYPCSLIPDRFFRWVCGDDCLSLEERREYVKKDRLCGWHIAAPKRYDTPKALSEFRKPDVWYKTETDNTSALVHETGTMITRPPQSWMYVEEIEE